MFAVTVLVQSKELLYGYKGIDLLWALSRTILVEHFLPAPLPRGGNKIKGFGDGNINQKLEKKEKRKFLKI